MVTPGGEGEGSRACYRNAVGMLHDEVAVPGSGVFRSGPPFPPSDCLLFFFFDGLPVPIPGKSRRIVLGLRGSPGAGRADSPPDTLPSIGRCQPSP